MNLRPVRPRRTRKSVALLFLLSLCALGQMRNARAEGAKTLKSSVTWVGFRPQQNGRSELFFVVSPAVTPRELLVGNRLFLMFDGAIFQKRTRNRALDTRYIESPVASITLDKIGPRGCSPCAKGFKRGAKSGDSAPMMRGAGLLVEVTFRQGESPTYQVTSEATTFNPVPPSQRVRAGEVTPRDAHMVRVGFAPPTDAVRRQTHSQQQRLLDGADDVDGYDDEASPKLPVKKISP